MLRGSYTASIDEKGRMRIPAVFKRYLEENYAGATDYYVTSLTGESALIYPMREWETIEAKLSLLPSQEPAKRKFLDRTNFYGQGARRSTARDAPRSHTHRAFADRLFASGHGAHGALFLGLCAPSRR